MSVEPLERNRRVLVIDDMTEIHTVFRRLLAPKPQATELQTLESSLFGAPAAPAAAASFEVDTAQQGQEGLARVQAGLAEGRPYAMAFVDMRMPPGWDGLQTIEAIWRADPDLEIVICTAHADYSDLDIVKRLGASDQVLFLRKPFDAIEVRQLARALTEKWTLRQQARLQLADLQRRMATRTRELSTVSLRLIDETEKRTAIDVEVRRARLVADVAGELDATLEILASPADAATAAEATRRLALLARHLVTVVSEHPGPAPAIDLNQAIASAADAMRDGVDACARLETDFGTLPPIPCSPADVNRVLLGLVDNAVQAVDAVKHKTGLHGRISISTRLEDGYGVVEISDSGESVPDEVRARIFEPLFQGGRTGLAVAQEIIVDQHGGQLVVESPVAGGSTVLVRLPVSAVDRRGARA